MNKRLALVLPFLLFFAAASLGQTSRPKWSMLSMDLPREVRTATPIGRKADSDVLHIAVGLNYRSQAGMQAFVDDVSNPRSPNYRHFITPEEVGIRFGLPSSSVKEVSDFLVSSGMKVRLVAKNRLSILADATVAQVESAFNTKLVDFAIANRDGSASSIRFSYTIPPSVPSEIRSFVKVIGGVESFTRPRPQSTLSPDQLRTLYTVAHAYNSGFQGQGRTIAISNWDGYLLSNIPLEYSQFNLPVPLAGVGSNVSVVSIDGADGNTFPAQGEGDIDIQCVLGMAPLCNLIIYDNAVANNQDLLGVVTQEADDNKADIITESYGWTPNTPLFEQVHAIHLSMSAQGITYLCASGDTGAEGLIGAPYPDEDPEVLTVGGTTVSTDSAGNRISEVVWDNSGYAGGGGWIPNSDSFNVLPSYQKGNGVPTNIPFRLIPDVALDADPYTGYEIYYQGVFTPGYGGTSCASPTMAGSLADCEQQIIAAGGLSSNSAGKQRLGRIQDLLYSYNGDPGVFYDIVEGTNGTLPDQSTSNAGPGWDTASGWGAPIFLGFVNRFLGIPTLAAFSVVPTAVVGGSSATGTVTINLAAPSGGFAVNLSSDSTQASVPASVTIPPGKTSATFAIGTTGGTSPTTVNLSATASGQTVTTTLTVNPSSITSVSISPNSVVGGNYSSGNVTLNGPAPAGGLDISLTSDNAVAMVPQHSEIPAGQTSGTFSIATNAVTSSVSANITASYNGNSASASITVGPASFSGFSVSPSSVQGGTVASGTITMNGTAPANGLTVNLTSNSSAASVPTAVTIPLGASSVTFSIATVPVSASTSVTLTASQGATSYTASLTVAPATLAGVTLSPTTVAGGSPSAGTVTLSGPAAAGGVSVKLSSSSQSASVPSSVTIPGGSSSVAFTVSTLAVSSSTPVTIFGSLGSGTLTAALTLTPATLVSLALAPAAVSGGSPATGTLTLSGPAGPNGATLSIKSNSANVTPPAMVTVPAGSNTVTFAISTSAVPATVSATVSATLAAVTETASLTVNPATVLGLTLSPSVVVGGSSSTGTVSLAGIAPSGGMVVNLTTKSGSASLPPTVTVAAGASSASFTVSTSVVSSTATATISASRAGITVSAGLTIQTPLLAGISVSPGSVVGGDSASGKVTLARPAPTGGVAVSLASSASVAAVPASVTVPSGSSSASFTVGTLGVKSNTTAMIAGSLSGTNVSTALSIQPPAISGFTISPPSVVGGSSVVGTISLNGPAPSGGLAIGVTTNSPSVTVPSTVTFASGTVTNTFTIGSKPVLAAVAATISVQLGSSTQSAPLAIQAPQLQSVSTNLTSCVGGSTSVVAGGVQFDGALGAATVVELKSSNSKVLSVPASVKVSSGTSGATFAVHHFKVTSVQTVVLTATSGGKAVTSSITVNPFGLSSLTIDPTSVSGGVKATGTVTLNATPTPASGSISVKLESSSKDATFSPTVFVPAGSDSKEFSVTTKAVAAITSAVITASIGSSSAQGSLSILPPGIEAVTVAPSSVKGSSTTQVTGTVTLTGAAPAGGIVVTLASSNSAAASVPSTMTILAGKTSGTFKVTHKAVTSATTVTIAGTLAGTTASTSLTVKP